MSGARVLADRYELRDVIGRGGMADVYLADDRLLGRSVAVKMLRDSPDAESDRARFTDEARMLAGLSHSGLVMVLDAGITAERPYLVMELVKGRTLAQAIGDGPLDLALTGSIAIQVSEALGYAHDQGVVHRDVKPGNVLLGVDDRVKLADFGIARLIGDTVHHTRTGLTIGTAAYLSPEQVSGEEVTPATDVYSLGLVLLEALTGTRAFPGSGTEAALARLTKSPDVPSGLPDVWRDLLTRMTARDPAARPTARQVAQGLESQPMGPVPVATIRAPGLGAAPGLPEAMPSETRVMTAPVGVLPEAPSLPDRLGEQLARQPGRWARWSRNLPPHSRGLGAAGVALVAFMVVVALAAGGDGGGGTDLPDNTPPQLQAPLSELHDAVHGE